MQGGAWNSTTPMSLPRSIRAWSRPQWHLGTTFWNRPWASESMTAGRDFIIKRSLGDMWHKFNLLLFARRFILWSLRLTAYSTASLKIWFGVRNGNLKIIYYAEMIFTFWLKNCKVKNVWYPYWWYIYTFWIDVYGKFYQLIFFN